MSDFLNRIADYSPKRLALLANQLNLRVESLESAAHEPIAIVGMACRLPGGADTPELYWDLLRAGVDAVVETPPDRWDVDAYYDPDPDAPGKLSSRHGGFLANVDGFDPGLFGIARREAQHMDPQQRLLLEVAWEALENAGLSADDVARATAGIFMGLSGVDYLQLLRQGGLSTFDAYAASGVAHSIASGRLAYVLGARGPALSIDTACSSSLVATHVAIQSLRSRECDLALAGGVNLILSPDITVALSRSHMMAPDGRCKAFDASADGFVRGEGCGVIVLKRLSDARAARDPIIAVIRGSALNQDGRSNGLTAPNGAAQEALLRAALANAQVDAASIGYVEAHGTGTKLGDPIEALALDAAFRNGRSAAPISVGSVKANIGHLEAAAGVASVIKLALMLKHGVVPPQVHFDTPNPHIPWDSLGLKVNQIETPWPVLSPEGKRIGGVSSFGFSGTNAHLILEEAPAPEPRPQAPVRPLHIVTASARTDAALDSLAAGYASALLDPGADLESAAHAANAGRTHFARRAAVVAATPREAAERLSALSLGEEPAMSRRGVAPSRAPRIAFLFTGQGAQHIGMARSLYETQPVFREALDRCDAHLKTIWPHGLIDVIFGDADEPAARLNDTTYTQPALFAVEYALAQLWASWGVRPFAVAGHSLGEITAACVAGMLSLEDALGLTAARGRLMGDLPRNGAMAAVMADEARVAAAIAPFRDLVSIGAINGPLNTVISGETGAVETISEALRAQGVTVTPLNVSHAFHSPLMEPMLEPFLEQARSVVWRTPQIELVSNVTGASASAAAARPEYWRDHVRAPVRFADSVATLARMGCDVFLEIGPHPVLTAMGQACLPDHVATWLGSLRRGQDDHATMLNALAGLYVAGAEVDWKGFDAPFAPDAARLPNYPFQRERFWVAETAAGEATPKALHSLLGWEVRQSLSADRLFETRLGVSRQPWLPDHNIHGAILTPSPVFIEMARAAGRVVLGEGALAVQGFELHGPLDLSGGEAIMVQTVMSPQTGDVRILHPGADGAWKTIATCRLARVEAEVRPAADLAALGAVLPEALDVAAYYERLGQLGLAFGPAFRGLEQARRRDGEALARVTTPEGLTASADLWLHPAVFDACLHTIGAAIPGASVGLSDPFLLIAIEELRMLAAPASGAAVWVHVTLRDADRAATSEAFLADIMFHDDSGACLAQFSGVALKRARAGAGAALPAGVRRLLHEIVWTPVRTPSPQEIEALLDSSVQAAADSADLAAYALFALKLDQLSTLYIVRALRALGWAMAVGSTTTARDLADRLRVLPRHARLFARMLAILEEDGVLVRGGEAWSVVQVPPADDAEAFAEALLAEHPDCEAELTLTRRCAQALASVLRGETDPLALLFPGGSLADTERLYQASPPARVYNGLVAEAAAAIAQAAGGRPLRILEVGAGTGSTTAHVLPRLADASFEYTFTDVSPLFLNRAREKFAAQESMRYELFDLEVDPAEQGFEAGAYDIIIGANVIHATRDLATSAARLRKLLSPEGRLILLEGVTPQRFGDLTVGMLEGWWAYTDTDRRQYALMPREAWSSLLADADFSAVTPIPPRGRGPILDQQAVFVAAAAAAAPSLWLLLPDAQDMARRVAEALRERGGEAVVLDLDQAPDGLRDHLRNAKGRVGVVSLAALDHTVQAEGEDLAAGQERLIAPTLGLIRTLSARAAPTKLYIVTRGGQATRPDESVEPAQATLWGLSHVVALEHAELGCVRIDLDPTAEAADAASALAEELCGASREDQVALRGRERLARRLTTRLADRARAMAPAGTIGAEGTYLVTGGLRGLGLLVAEWLVDQGARSLALMGRAAPDENAKAAVARMQARGARVLTLAGDVSLRADVERGLAAIAAAAAPLKGVFHCAGVLDDGVLMSQTWARFAPVMAPKVQGAWNLHALCGEVDLFVMFSSGASVAGSAGQANHAAANAFEDALAWMRQAQGRPALSINWGPWADVGAAADRTMQSAAGFLRAMSPQDGLAALSACLWRAQGERLFRPAQLAVFDADWSALASAGQGFARAPIFSGVAAETATRAGSGPAARRGASEERPWRERLMAAPANRRRALLREEVRALAAKVLGAAPRSLDIEEPLRDLGLDSLMAVELRNRLGAAVGRTLPATITFDCPTVAALVAYLVDEGVIGEAEPDANEAPAASPAPADQYENQTEAELAATLAAKLSALQFLNEPG